jgi:serine O-acetyltransferase
MPDPISTSWLPINSKQGLRFYQEADLLALRIKTHTATQRITDALGKTNLIWRYLHLLRTAEYVHNCKTPSLYKLTAEKYLAFRLQRLGLVLGFDIPLNAFGPGLRLVHSGTIIVNKNARIGANCELHNLVHIAQNLHIAQKGAESDKAPTIGDNVFIGPGARVIGDITLADGIVIGANSVVTKSFFETNITIAGVPARKISDSGSDVQWGPGDNDDIINYLAAHKEQFSEHDIF